MGEFQNNSGFPDIPAIMRKSHNKWGSHLMFLDVGLPPVSSRVFQHGLCVHTVNFGGGFESQMHFPQCYYHPYPKKVFKIHHILLECRLYAQLCSTQKGVWLRGTYTWVLLERHFKHPYSGSTPGMSAVGKRQTVLWEPGLVSCPVMV